MDLPESHNFFMMVSNLDRLMEHKCNFKNGLRALSVRDRMDWPGLSR